jgi:predicted dehydrogenase
MTVRSRRGFMKATGGAVAYATTAGARAQGRVLGANDRINIGFLGCGARSAGLRRMVEMSWREKNLGVVAVCDLWTQNREKAAADCKARFGTDVRQFQYSEQMLEMKDLDAVMIATGDHQHALLLRDVVASGRDCYCEKPMAETVEEAKVARDAVLGSRQVVQMGSQWLSDPVQQKVRALVRSGALGRVTKIEQSWNDNNHRWHDPEDPDVRSLREEDTDWKRWLMGRRWRPFDPRVYFEFRIVRDFSGGITSQWMSHGIGLVHFYTDTAIPDSMVANGGIFGWEDVRENPDTFSALSTYDEAKLLYSYSSSYANRFGDYSLIRGKDASLYAHGGEGSPRWFLVEEGQKLPGGFDSWAGMKDAVGQGRAKVVTADEYGDLPPPSVSDDSKWHLDNWVDCMRSRDQATNGHVLTGFWHSVGAIMATRAYREGKKLYWDRKREEIVDAAPASGSAG